MNRKFTQKLKLQERILHLGLNTFWILSCKNTFVLLKKILLPTILGFILSGQTLFGQTSCESSAMNFQPTYGKRNVPSGLPSATNPPFASQVTNINVTYGGKTVSAMSDALYTAFVPNQNFILNFNSSNTVTMTVTVYVTSWQYTTGWMTTGSSTSTNVYTIEQQPTATLNNLTPASFCSNVGTVSLSGGSPSGSGGSYSVDNVSVGSSFDPSNMTVGSNHSVSYTYYDHICPSTTSASTPITIIAPATVNINGAPTNNNICVNASSITLTPDHSLTGGQFSGPGVSAGGLFTPSPLIVGANAITYSGKDQNQCTSTSNPVTINVKALPSVGFANFSVCIDRAAFTLTQGSGTPLGGSGVYGGSGVTNGNVFTALTAGVGNKTLTYTYTDPFGCVASNTNTTTVNALPVPSFPDQGQICVNGSPKLLTGGSATPAGGTGVYSGPGVNQTTGYFTPASNMAGTQQTVVYTYKDLNGCVNTINSKILVNALTSLTMDTAAVCLSAAPVTLSTAMKTNHTGGTYSIIGNTTIITNGNFSPSIAGTGLKTITYTYTDANQCTNMVNSTMRVRDVTAPVTLANVAPVCMKSNPFALTSGSPAGGIYSGTNGIINGTSFDPSNLTNGSYPYYYTYTDASGCSKMVSSNLTILNKNKPEIPAVSFNSIMCKGSDQVLQVSNKGTNTVQWYDSNNLLLATAATDTIKNITQDLTINVKYTDADNCFSDMKIIAVLLDKVKADFSVSSASVKIGGTATVTNSSTNAISYNWVMSGTSGTEQTQNVTSPTFNFNITGAKSIKLVASSQNCKDSVTKTNIITVTPLAVSNLKGSLIKVYPNPVKEVVNVDLTGVNKDVAIRIFSLDGKKLVEKQIKTANGIESIDASYMASGIYMMVVTIDGDTVTFKLEKK